MAVLNSQHLLDQASRLITTSAGAPRQADIRRAISTAYYAVFHYALTCVADQIVGKTKRSESLYGLVYRSIDHRRLKDVCPALGKPAIPDKFKRYVPSNGLGVHVQEFAKVIIDLQEKRHDADYNPAERVATVDALFAMEIAKSAIRRFERAQKRRKTAFLMLLVFSPR